MPDPFSLSGSALTCTDATSANALLLPRSPLDDVDATTADGQQLAKAERVEASIEDQVSGRLHAVALDALGMAPMAGAR